MNSSNPLHSLEIDSQRLQQLVVDVVDGIFTRHDAFEISQKADGSLVTQYDTALQAALSQALKADWPEIPLLGEEMDTASQRRIMSSDAFWCLDPLDGTTNFTNNIPFFAVSLALIHRGRSICGVVYDPSHRECFRADQGRGAWLNDHSLVLNIEPRDIKECVAIVDLKRLPGPLIQRLSESQPYRSQRSLGSVALEWCWLGAGRAQLYLHGAQRIWDYAAGLLIFRESGGCGSIVDLVTGKHLVSDRDLEANAAIGASTELLLGQWKTWLYDTP